MPMGTETQSGREKIKNRSIFSRALCVSMTLTILA